MHIRRLLPLLATAAFLLAVTDLSLVIIGHRMVAMLVRDAFKNGKALPAVISQVSNAISSLQGQVQAVAAVAAPLALAVAGISYGAGSRRGLVAAGAALGGLALALLATPIAN